MGLCMCLCGKAEDDPLVQDFGKIESYTGETKLGKRHGRGYYFYPNGDVYDGEWKWGKKHGFGTYTYHGSNSQRIGYFYEDEYIGTDPDNRFAVETKVSENDPNRPLTPPPTQAEIEAKREREQAQQRIANERHLENERKREERRQKREEMRKKYDLAIPGTSATSNQERISKNRPRTQGRRRDRLLEPNKRVGYDSVQW